MVTGTEGPSTLLLSHPHGIVSPPLYLNLSQQEGHPEDAHIDSAHIQLLQRRLGNEVIPLTLGAKLPNYLHRKSDYYILVNKKDYSFTKLTSRKSQ